MQTTYRLNADNIDASFLEEIKSAFAGKSVEIVVSEAPTEVCLYDFDELSSDDTIAPEDVHIDDGSIQSFLASGKKTLIGPNGEKPVGKLIQIKTKDTPDKRWQDLFDKHGYELEAEEVDRRSAGGLEVKTTAPVPDMQIVKQNSKAGVQDDAM